MSQRSVKKQRRLFRKTIKYHYDEFLKDVAKCKFSDRFRIAREVLKQKGKKKMKKFIENYFYPFVLVFFLASGVGAWIIIILNLLGAV